MSGYDAIAHLNALKTDIGIVKIIIVDDDMDLEETEKTLGVGAVLNALIDAANSAKQLEIKELHLEQYDLMLFDINGNIKDEIALAESVTPERWEAVPHEVRESFFSIVGMPDTRAQTREGLDSFSQNVSSVIDVETISVREWNKRKGNLGELGRDSYVIVLFDLNLKNVSPHDADFGRYDEGGAVLGSQALETLPYGYIPGILTANIDTGKEEIEGTDGQFVAGRQLGMISKKRLEKPKDIVKGLESIIAANILYELEREALEIFGVQQVFADAASEPSCKHLGLGILSRMIKQAEDEGEHLSNGVIRLMGERFVSASQGKMRERCMKNKKIGLLGKIKAEQFNTLLGIEADETEDCPLRFDDAYIAGKTLAQRRYPTMTGDVYELTFSDGATVDCVLLVQPCNLSIRGDSEKRGANITHFPLVELKMQRSGTKPDHRISYGSRIPAPKDILDCNDEMVFCQPEFSECRYVAPYLLDLCVFSEDGRASTEFLANGGAIMMLEPGWQLYKGSLERGLLDRIEKYNQLMQSASVNDALEEGFISNEGILKSIFSITENYPEVKRLPSGAFSFGIRRKARLKEHYAHGLLLEFARYQSRYGFPGRLI